MYYIFYLFSIRMQQINETLRFAAKLILRE